MEPYNLEDILHDLRELKIKLTSVLPTIKKSEDLYDQEIALFINTVIQTIEDGASHIEAFRLKLTNELENDDWS